MLRPTNKLISAALTIALTMVMICHASLAQDDKSITARRPVHPNAPAAQSKPDLVVRILGAPTTAHAGDDIGPALKIVAKNIGGSTAAGTGSAGDNGYMIDLMLSVDANVPEGFATFSSSFIEDALMAGGRVSNTKDLAAITSASYPAGAGIPADTPPGAYYLCARIDPANKIAESNEANNVECVKLTITSKAKSKRNGADPMSSKRPQNP
ncbi:MAG: hypothetical protein QOD00_2164 [Blastocatellia bacterium]|nr:hypothetical protein [Blastocatellia bacterium]